MLELEFGDIFNEIISLKWKFKKKSPDFVLLMVATVIISHLSAVLFKELHTKNVLDCILKSKWQSLYYVTHAPD